MKFNLYLYIKLQVYLPLYMVLEAGICLHLFDVSETWDALYFDVTESTIKSVGNLTQCYKHYNLARTGYINIMMLWQSHFPQNLRNTHFGLEITFMSRSGRSVLSNNVINPTSTINLPSLSKPPLFSDSWRCHVSRDAYPPVLNRPGSMQLISS